MKTFIKNISIFFVLLLSMTLTSCSGLLKDSSLLKELRSIESIDLTSSSNNVDTYTITYTDNTTSTFTITNGIDGQCVDKGDDGLTPYIGDNGNWWIGNEDTLIKAQGPKGETGSQGIKGDQGIQGEKGETGDTGASITTVTLNDKNEVIVTLSNGDTINAGVLENDHKHSFTCAINNSTCTEQGLITLTCSTCGKVETSIINPMGHQYGQWYETKPATCNQDGEKCRICKICNEKDTVTVDKHDHTYSTNFLYDTASHWQYCLTCGIKNNEKSHNISTGGICSTCDYKEIQSGSSNGLVFALRDDKQSYALIDTGTFDGTEIEIPSTYNDLPVVEIGTAFSGNKTIKTILIPNSVTTIVSSAFNGCESLTTVSLPDNLTVIPEKLFYKCRSLTSITIPNSVTSIGSNAFNNCSSLTSITIPDSVTSIESQTFYLCCNLTSITIPDSVTSIGNYAFDNCSSLTSIVLPNTVTSIGESALAYCSSLTSIVIPNTVTSIGINAFISCPSLKSVIFKETKGWVVGGVALYKEAIENPSTAARYLNETYSSYYWCRPTLEYTLNNEENGYTVSMLYSTVSKMTDITILSEYNDLPVTSIRYNAFSDCSSLTSITIPDSVTSIGNYAFYNCLSLTSITYDGTISEWNSISKNSVWNYNIGTNTVHCTDGDVNM